MDQFVRIFPAHLHQMVKSAFARKCRPEEFRIRIGQPLQIYTGEEELFWNEKDRGFTEKYEESYRITREDLREMVASMSHYSLYAFEEEIRSGFLTIEGGHRVGIGGKVVCEHGSVKTIRHISFLNIRVAGQIFGCADPVMPYIRKGDSIYNTLIISCPGAGKTTLLRDCIRQISDGGAKWGGLKVGVVDERSELAACYLGEPQNDLGIRTDVLDGCPKAEGMLLLLRTMSPQVIGVDELGGEADFEAVERVLHCGCKIIGTLHGENMEEMLQKPYLEKWITQGFFERFLFLKKKSGKERQWQILNERQEQIC